jgi:hypothetical protein
VLILRWWLFPSPRCAHEATAFSQIWRVVRLHGPRRPLGQPFNKLPKIGVLWHAANAEDEALGLGTLARGFSDLGYSDGKNIALYHKFPAEAAERFASLSSELAAVPVDVLVAVTQPAALAQRARTKNGDVRYLVAVGGKSVANIPFLDTGSYEGGRC